MSPVPKKITATNEYLRQLTSIEDFIFASSNGSLQAIAWFLKEHQKATDFILVNPTTPPIFPQTGEQIWAFGSHYQIFFIRIETLDHHLIYLNDIIDTRQANLRHYPNNNLPTYTLDDEE